MIARLLFFFLCGLPLHLIWAAPQVTVEWMREVIGSLEGENSFAFFDLGLSEQENKAIEQLEINVKKHLLRPGNLPLLLEELPIFLQEIGNDDDEVIQTVTHLIFEIALKVAETFQKETAWIRVSAFLPCCDFDLPRWHIDTYYYPPYSGVGYKFVTALKGNQTLFYRLPKQVRKKFMIYSNHRQFLNQWLDLSQSETMPSGYGAFFTVGGFDDATVHSEPPLEQKRLFLEIFAGDEQEIAQFYENYREALSRLLE